MSHQFKSWWGAPRAFSERRQERKISWLELFFDLVYVATIDQLTHHIANHPSWSTIGYSFLLFALVFWSWVNASQYYDLHGNDSIRTRLFTFYQMLAVAAVAITLNDAFEGYHVAFSIAFAAIQFLITYLWWSVGFFDPSHRVFSKFYTFNYAIAFALLVVSAFTSSSTATILWVLVLILNLTPPFTVAPTIKRELGKIGQVFTASNSLVERFGLFTIIVLAESILSTVTGIAEVKDKLPSAWIAFFVAILLSFLLWSLYFDMTSEQETKAGYGYMLSFIFLHFPLLASLGIVGACIKTTLVDMSAGMTDQLQWMFCSAMSIILISIVGLTLIMKQDEEDRSYIKPVSRLLVIVSIAIVLLPMLQLTTNTLVFLSLIAVLLLVPVFFGIRSWVLYKFYRKEESAPDAISS